MMIGANNTSHIEECHNDKADHAPTWETYHKALDVEWKLLLQREVSIRHVSDRINMCDSLELLSKIFCVMLDNIVVPKNIQPFRATSPVYQEECSPNRHDD